MTFSRGAKHFFGTKGAPPLLLTCPFFASVKAAQETASYQLETLRISTSFAEEKSPVSKFRRALTVEMEE